MSDPHRVKGWWFLPAAPDERVPGWLTWTQDKGAVLELIGGFSRNSGDEGFCGFPSQSGPSMENAPLTIYGETDLGKPLTLWNAERGNYSLGSGGIMHAEVWRTSWVCVGAYLPTADAPVLCDLSATLDNLYFLTEDSRFLPPKWAQIEGVDRPGETQEDGTCVLPFVLPIVGGLKAGVASGSTAESNYYVDTHATRPPVSSATEAMPGLKLDMMTRRTRSGPQIVLSVGAQARVTLRDVDATSARDLLARLSPLRDLMSLATCAASGIESVHSKTIEGERVSLLCQLGHPSMPDAPAESAGIVFTFEDVSLEHFLETRRRLTAGQQAEYAWNVVIGLIGHSPRMVEEHVSQVLAAAEGFHRWCLGLSATSLKQRLIRLYDRLPDEVRTRLSLDVDEWSGWATWARNQVAHGGTRRSRTLDDFYQMKVIADSVRLVTYMVVLQELDVPIPKLTEALLNHPQISVLTKRCADLASLPKL